MVESTASSDGSGTGEDIIRTADSFWFNIVPGAQLKFTYKNWKGRVREVNCIVESFGIGANNEYHGQKCREWYIHGFDLDKQARRSYRLLDIVVDTVKHP